MFTGCNNSSDIQRPANKEKNRGKFPYLQSERLNITRITIKHDQDGDGINDLEDILAGARNDAVNKPAYRSAYYSGGYPPDNEGVCTDTVYVKNLDQSRGFFYGSSEIV